MHSLRALATNANPSFGQGVEGYAERFGTAYADFGIQNLMTEGFSRRYCRREGSGPTRLGYAISRLFITRSDSGKHQFNYSEVVGGATSLAISNAYYPDGRNFGNNMHRYTLQLGFDAASNVLKEFWPDLKRKLPARFAPPSQP